MFGKWTKRERLAMRRRRRQQQHVSQMKRLRSDEVSTESDWEWDSQEIAESPSRQPMPKRLMEWFYGPRICFAVRRAKQRRWKVKLRSGEAFDLG